MKNKKLTTASGRPYFENEDSMTVGPRGSLTVPVYKRLRQPYLLNDHYTQPGKLFRKVMTEEQRKNTVSNFVASMKGISGPKRKEIIMRQLDHFHKADKELALSVAKGLGIKYNPGKTK